MAKAKSRYTSYQRKKFSLQSAKAKLRFSNFLIGILCVVALVFLYIQPFFSVQVSYAVQPQTLRQILQEQMGSSNISEEDLKDVDLTLGFSLTIEGKGLSSLLGDELNTLIRMGNGGGSGSQSSSSSGETQSPEDQTGSDSADSADQLSFFAAVYADEQQDPSDSGQSSSDSDQSSSDSGQTSSDTTSSSDDTSVSSGEKTEENALLQRLLQACKDNEVVQSAISASVDELITQAKAAVPRVVAIYVKVVVREQAQQSSTGTSGNDDSSSSNTDSGSVSDSGSDSQDTAVELPTVALPSDSFATAWTARRPYAKYLSGGTFASSNGNDFASQIGNLDVDELTKKIEELLSKDSVTVAEAQQAVMDYVKENQEALGLTDESIGEVETQVGDALNSMAQQFGEQVTDENGELVVDENGNPVMAIRPNEVVTDLLVQAGMVDKDKAESGAELSELLTEYIMTQMGETGDALYYTFMAFSLVLAVLYVLWGFLLIKSIVKVFTGTPMGAFFVKLLTGLPFLLLVLIPTICLSVLGMEGILNMLASAGMGDLSAQLTGLSLAVSGGWVAFACTVVLFVFGFLYSSFKREYKHAKKDLD